MKIGILTNCFKEERFIFGCIGQFKKLGVDHLVLISEHSWCGNMELGNDRTGEIALDAGARVCYGDWKTEAEQFNTGLWYFGHYDWIIICDADERYERVDIKNLMLELENTQAMAIKAPKMKVFWKTPDYMIFPHDNGEGPIIAVRPSVRFEYARRTNANDFLYSESAMHHFSYVRSDEEMLKKISTFSHAEEFNTMEWYNNVWLKWTPEMRNIHPTVPYLFPEAKYMPEECSENIRKTL